MYIRTSGKPTKVSMPICKESIRFFGKKLLSDNLYHKINLKIDFKYFNKENKEYAYCEWEFNNHRSRDFIITIDRSLGKRNMLLALAHEMVHVKQYAKGELKDYLRVNKCKWLGETFDTDEIDYWEQPWEIEAHGREKGLYVKYLEFVKFKKD
jgi:hypothetical protein